jgi:type IV secretory pathway VirD2 relaxase
MRITVSQLRQIIREELKKETTPGTPQNPSQIKKFVMSEIQDDDDADESMYESQRGNDENGQHDNDTDPSDPYERHLRESIRRLLRRR